MIKFDYGTYYSFSTLAPFVLGNKHEELLYGGTVSYFVANKLGVNCYLTHRQIYHLLPKNTPDNPTLYLYHLFITDGGNIKIFGDPWINTASIKTGKRLNVIITIPNVLNDDLAIIRDKLRATGIGNNEYTVSKIRSMNGINNSIYQILTGETPVGGGLEDNPTVDDEETLVDEGSSQIYQPYILTELTELNPYIKIRLSPFLDALNVGALHVSTEYQIASDNTFSSPIVDESKTTDLTTIVDPKVLEDNNTYYLRFRYVSNTNINSKWSETYSFKYREYYTAPSGRKYKRHDNDLGTIMTWTDKQGNTHDTFIFDSAYRSSFQFIKMDAVTDGLNNHTGSNMTLDLSMSDDDINSLETYFEDTGSSLENTSAYMTTDKRTNTACGFAINQLANIDDANYVGSIPTIQIAVRIMADKRVIDELDPTVANNTHNLYVATKAIWSSTKNSSSEGRLSVWTVSNNTLASPQLVDRTFTVVPIIELN